MTGMRVRLGIAHEHGVPSSLYRRHHADSFGLNYRRPLGFDTALTQIKNMFGFPDISIQISFVDLKLPANFQPTTDLYCFDQYLLVTRPGLYRIE